MGKMMINHGWRGLFSDKTIYQDRRYIKMYCWWDKVWERTRHLVTLSSLRLQPDQDMSPARHAARNCTIISLPQGIPRIILPGWVWLRNDQFIPVGWWRKWRPHTNLIGSMVMVIIDLSSTEPLWISNGGGYNVTCWAIISVRPHQATPRIQWPHVFFPQWPQCNPVGEKNRFNTMKLEKRFNTMKLLH
jgi:hypothetical protein